MIITFLGVGSAFSNLEDSQSNMLVTAPSGKRLLIDCGSDIRHSLRDMGITAADIQSEIDAVYISHCHSDHVGGLEFVAFTTYFGEKRVKLKLFAEENLLRKVWDESLKGGLNSIQGKTIGLDDYFDCRPVGADGHFVWEGMTFSLVGMPHITHGDEIGYSYGLLIRENDAPLPAVFISTDSQFQPDTIIRMAQQVSLIFHDCETTPVTSGVHAHYEQLRTLPEAVRSKIWLYHYHADPDYDAEANGFRGFVRKGQEFNFGMGD